MLLCPVRALRYYLDRTKSIRGKKELLFISFRRNFEKDIVKSTISSWLIATIRECLKHCTNEAAAIANVRAHDIRMVVASWAFKNAVPLGIIQACAWTAHNTFTSFYLKEVFLV